MKLVFIYKKENESMPVRRYRRRVVRPRRRVPYTFRRTRGRYFRRRTRFHRTRRIGFRKWRHVQNLVRFHCKHYEPVLAQFTVENTPATENTRDVQTFQVPITMTPFITGNRQFFKNLDEYHFVKFNYFAIHVKELTFMGYTYSPLVKPSEEDVPYPATQGVTAMQTNNLPMYVYWDLEADMSFGPDDHIQVNQNQLAQYPGTKKIFSYRNSVAKLIYRVPVPWRQFTSTYNFKLQSTGQYLQAIFRGMFTSQELRSPRFLLCSIPNWWKSFLPVNGATNAATMIAHFAIEYHMGCTFRGRNVMGPNPVSFADVDQNMVVSENVTIPV